jgi:hypothetical protein
MNIIRKYPGRSMMRSWVCLGVAACCLCASVATANLLLIPGRVWIVGVHGIASAASNPAVTLNTTGVDLIVIAIAYNGAATLTDKGWFLSLRK